MISLLRDKLFFLVGTLGLVFLLLVAAVGYLVTETHRSLRAESYDTEGMASVQLRLHFERMIGAISEYGLTEDAETARDAINQFDILYSRLQFLPERSPYNEFLDEAVRNDIAAARRLLSNVVPLVDAATEGSLENLTQLRAQLLPLRPILERVAARTTQLAAEYQSAKRDDALMRSNWLAVFIIGLIFLGTAFAAIILRQLRVADDRNTELEEMTMRLSSAVEETRRANRAKSDFLAHMSHELRTPLNAIIGFSEVMRNEVLGTHSVAHYKSYSEDINKSGSFLLSIINDLLDLSRIETGTIELSKEPVELRAVVEDCLSIVKDRIAAKHIDLNTNFGDPLPACEADPVRLRQIVLNLLTNAAKFTPDGGHIAVTVARVDDEGVCIRVNNSGESIPPGQMTMIFEPFQQAGNVMKKRHDGVGLGLSITRRLVELHDGSIVIESDLKSGTTVEIVLPFH